MELFVFINLDIDWLLDIFPSIGVSPCEVGDSDSAFYAHMLMLVSRANRNQNQSASHSPYKKFVEFNRFFYLFSKNKLQALAINYLTQILHPI